MATVSTARIHAAAAARFGEAVTLPSGTVTGVVSLPPVQPMLRVAGTRTGAVDVLQHQAEPSVWLRHDDAATVHEGDEITMRGTDYSVVELLPDGSGMTLLRLVPAAAEPETALPTEEGWR